MPESKYAVEKQLKKAQREIFAISLLIIVLTGVIFMMVREDVRRRQMMNQAAETKVRLDHLKSVLVCQEDGGKDCDYTGL